MQDVTEEAEDEGLGQDDDSVESADEANLLTEAMVDTAADRFGNEEDDVVFSDANGIRGLDPSNTLDLEKLIPQPPIDWVAPPWKELKGESTFDEVDNPGDWKCYSFQPTFNKKTGMYLHHALPTKCTPVPLINGERVSNGWTFSTKDGR
jgi:hypothetical protein